MNEQGSQVVMQPRTSELAIVSLVCGVAGILNPLPGFALGIVGIVLGIKARAAIQASEGTMTGSGLALTGLICGIVSTVGGFLYFCSLGIFVTLVLLPILVQSHFPHLFF
jgi:hypothetical protein